MPKIDVNVSENVTDLANKPIHNLFDKSTAALGNGLASAFSLVFAPIEYLGQSAQLAYQYRIEKKQLSYQKNIEAYKQELEDKVKKIPQENLIEPDFHTAYEALENSKSCITDEELRKMFVNLISSSMNSTTSDSVHPSFASIIKQMSVLDAKVLMTFKFRKDHPILELRERDTHGGYQTVMTNFFIYITLNENEQIDLNITQIQNSISNLDRLGLVDVDYSKRLTNEQCYSDLEENANRLYEGHSVAVENRMMQRGIVFLTPLGESFIRVCLSD